MQVMPGTAPEAARLAGLPWDAKKYREDENYNRAIGQAYYKKMLRDFGGDPLKAAAAYNAGPGNMQKILRAAEKAGRPEDWEEFIPARLQETKDYVANFKRKTGAAGGVRGGERSCPGRSFRRCSAAILQPYGGTNDLM